MGGRKERGGEWKAVQLKEKKRGRVVGPKASSTV